MQKHWARIYAQLQLSTIFFYEHRLSFYSYKDLFLSFQSIFLAQRSIFSLSAEEEMDYSHHYLTLGMTLGLPFPASQEQKLASILKYNLQNLNHLLGGTCAELREECEEEGEAETKSYEQTTIPPPIQKGEEVEKGHE